MKNAGINTLLIRRDSATGTAIALITNDSERTFATHLGAAVELTDDDLNPILFIGYDILYLEGYLINNFPLIEMSCKRARENNMLIALDLASYNVVEENLESFRKIIEAYVDILFANEQEAHAFTGLEPEKALAVLSRMSQTVILKAGAEGSWVKRDNDLIKVSSFPVKCLDTTGAGDLYAAGFIYGLANGLNPEKCGIIGSLLAGKVIEIVGARMDKEKYREIKEEIGKLISD
jgi:sugar/nucleoside kinase (ribokinase family)